MDDIQGRLTQWIEEARTSARAHGRAARRMERGHHLLGIPTIVLTTIVATSVFASLSVTVNPIVKVGVGVLTVIAAVMSSLQTFLNFGHRGEQHRTTEAAWKSYSRELEMLFFFPGDAETVQKRLDELSSRWHEIQVSSPNLRTVDFASQRRLHGHGSYAQSGTILTSVTASAAK